jgi:hypothetical protein
LPRAGEEYLKFGALKIAINSNRDIFLLLNVQLSSTVLRINFKSETRGVHGPIFLPAFSQHGLAFNRSTRGTKFVSLELF